MCLNLGRFLRQYVQIYVQLIFYYIEGIFDAHDLLHDCVRLRVAGVGWGSIFFPDNFQFMIALDSNLLKFDNYADFWNN